MDNAGGHGKREVRSNFVKILKERYNIQVTWQVPNSPETNMLDLGIFRALQSAVEKLHRDLVMVPDVLAATVERAFDGFNHVILNKVSERWKLVLDLIISGRGSNDLVEKHHGLKAKLEEDLSIPDSDDEDNERVIRSKVLVKEEEIKKAQKEGYFL